MREIPIPLFVLRHRAKLITEYRGNKWGGDCVKRTEELINIRVEPCHSVQFSKISELPEITAKLFYDCTNSSPKNNPFRLSGDEDYGGVVSGQTVVFGGRDYKVVKIESFYGTEKLHHLEVYLS